MCSGRVLGSDFRGNEIGVATVEGKDRTFTKLTEAKIVAHLNAINRRC